MSDPTPSETLRAAAERLRAMAAKATDGPWRWNGSQVDVEPTTRGTYVVGDGQQEDDVVTPEDGAWIATMSPVVAEPLAAWLDAEANCQDSIAGTAEHLPKLIDSIAGEPLGAALRVIVDTGPQALAFARSILGGTDV